MDETKKITITTSWDDGHNLDLRVLELLKKYNLKGTFYIPRQCQFRSLTDEEIVKISQTQEVGAHTTNHRYLKTVDSREAELEVLESKKWLEGLVNQPVRMFCYPGGQFNDEIKKKVKESGFDGARTTEEFVISYPEDNFVWGTTIHIYPFPFRKRDAAHYHWSRFLAQPLGKKIFKMIGCRLPLKAYFNWSNLAIGLFEYTVKRGQIFHLWGHSWEIERYGMWEELERVLKHISQRKDCLYLTNGQILKKNQN